MQWLGFEANLPPWSAAALLQSGTYTEPPIRFLVSSSNDFTRWSPSIPQKMPNFSGQREFLYLSFNIANRNPRLVHVHMCYSNISIREQWLFHSARPEVRQQFESGVWLSKYGIFFNCRCLKSPSWVKARIHGHLQPPHFRVWSKTFG